MSHYRWHEDTLLIYCHIQASAAQNGFAGLRCAEQNSQRLKVRVTAAAIGGGANNCLIKYLATQFGVPKSRVQLLKGQTTRYKTIAIEKPKKIPAQTDIARP